MESKELKRIGKILEKEFKAKQITLYKLEKLTGLQGHQINSIFSGSKFYTIKSLLLISEALGKRIYFK